MHSFTQEDLVQYLYNESSPEKAARIKASLETDWNLREEFEVISSASKGLEDIKLSPRKIAVDNILKYAEKSIKTLSTEV
ncbi:hypothetical protein BH11BAC3_BH11BAC3_28880 [soil metagenome]